MFSFFLLLFLALLLYLSAAFLVAARLRASHIGAVLVAGGRVILRFYPQPYKVAWIKEKSS
jgi:hypothetical protein